MRNRTWCHDIKKLNTFVATLLFAAFMSSAIPTAAFAVSDSDVIFNYAEAAYPQFLSPAGGVSNIAGVYYYRYYPGTNAYIATTDGRFLYLGPASNYQILDLGASSVWLSTSLGNSATLVPGIYTGQSGTGSAIAALMLADGTYWFLHNAPATPYVISYLYKGSGRTSNGSFSSSAANGYGLPFSGLREVTLGTSSGAYSSSQFSGQFIASSSASSFSTEYSSLSASTPVLSQLVGSFSQDLTATIANFAGARFPVTIQIASSGAITGTVRPACIGPDQINTVVTGRLTPRSDINAYDMSLSFDLGVSHQICPSPLRGYTFNGIAYYDASSSRLALAGVSVDAKAIGFSAPGPN